MNGKTVSRIIRGIVALVGAAIVGEAAVVSSPDGRNEIRLWTSPLAYEVSRDGKVLVAKTEIGLTVEGKGLNCGGEDAPAPTMERRVVSGEAASPVYKKAKVDLAANEEFADFGEWGIRLVARNDGVAYRFETKFPGTVTVDWEKAGVTLDPKSECYVNFNHSSFKGDPLQNSWESVSEKHLSGEITIPDGKIAYLPFVFRSADGTAVCVTESDLVDYPGWNLKRGESGEGVLLRGEFAKFPKPADPGRGGGTNATSRATQRQRSLRVSAREDHLVKTDGTRTFPWRCFMIAKDASKLVENDLVWALATPSKAGDGAWIRPGKVAWDWWNAWDNLGPRKGCTTKGYERFIDFAAKNGVEYVILDEGWSEKLDIWRYNPNVDVPHLIRYASERGVGIILWMAWAQVVGEEERVASHFAKLGAKGFKVDFMDRDDAACVNFLWKFAEACAKEKMLVDYHGMYKPTGMERTYPNVLNFEGVHGLEQMKWYGAKWDMMASDVRSYFVRMSAGPMDYTPGAMDNYPVGERSLFKGTGQNPGSLGTRCRQMAMMALYFAPLQMLCDAPTKYEGNMESFKFMAATPVVWDETVGLAGDPDAMCACARRNGDVWYAAGMTNADGRDYGLDTSFLGEGMWNAEIFRDAADADTVPTHYVHEQGKAVKAGDRLDFRMAKGGGFVVKFTKPATRPEAVAWPVLKRYDRDHLQQVVLPLGGIGTGTIGLTGRGELRDWELFNDPNVKAADEQPQFAITAQGAKTPAASVLLAGPLDDHQLVNAGGRPCPYAGYPRFAEASFDAAFPFGTVHLSDPALPYRVDVRAFSPFVPGDSAASSEPLASIEYVVENLTDEPLAVSVAGFGRPAMDGRHVIRESETLRGLETVSSAGGDDRRAGSYVLVTDREGEASYRTSGIRDSWRWHHNELDFWDDFTDDGRLEPREPFNVKGKPEARPLGALCVSKTVPARGKASFRFAYVWRFPNRYGWCKTVVGNWYARNYTDAWDAAQRIWPRIPELERRTASFVRAFLSSDEPEAVKDAALSNLSVLKSQTVFRDGEGRLMGYEGMGDGRGLCVGMTTHVWNYEFATAALFGDLARTQRENELVHSTRDDGWMVIRYRLPLDRQVFGVDWDSRTAADGQMGCVMKAYREWKWSGDTAWLRSVWPKARKALEFAWTGASKWDADADGLMEGEQHNTFDINFYGPNPLCEFWYLGALRAGEEMAKAVGDAAFAAECRRLFASGSKLTDERLFNGEYYWQLIPEDRRNEVFQLGTGCLSDQLLGQQTAHLLGLGDLASRTNARKTCESIMKYNFKEDFTHHFTNMRVYCAGNDAGLLVSSWPRGGREKFPFVYFSEVWTGIEYVAAAEMVFQGMDAEALKIVSSARARHDGRRRNPFNEFECGYHYARSLAAWNVHLAWTGFQYDGLAKKMTFGRDGNWFWSNGSAWGTAKVRDGKPEISVVEGRLPTER